MGPTSSSLHTYLPTEPQSLTPKSKHRRERENRRPGDYDRDGRDDGDHGRVHDRSPTPFRRDPGNVLGRVLNVTGFTVDAVLGVDLELLAATIVLIQHIIHTSRAVALRRLVVFRQVFLDGNLRVGRLQVNGLVFLVVGVRNKHR